MGLPFAGPFRHTRIGCPSAPLTSIASGSVPVQRRPSSSDRERAGGRTVAAREFGARVCLFLIISTQSVRDLAAPRHADAARLGGARKLEVGTTAANTTAAATRIFTIFDIF